MTMPRWEALSGEWRAHPPAHWLIAAYLQYKPPTALSEAPGAPPGAISRQALMAAIPGGGMPGSQQGLPPHG